jgi:hypothetical protein
MRGEPAGFDVDWPEYAVSTESQGTLPLGAYWDRVARYADSALPRIEANLDRFECGYIDLGAHKRKGARIQSGCFLHHTGPLRSGDGIYASVEVIPLGLDVVPDPGWPVTSFIADGLPWDLCRAVPRACEEPPSAIRPVPIDVKPADSPNTINAGSEGTVPGAILSSEPFDAPARVDRGSLRFGRTGAEASLAFCNRGEDGEDVNGDGLGDLVCHFRTASAGFRVGDTEGILTGRSHEGDLLRGRDSVRIIPSAE